MTTMGLSVRPKASVREMTRAARIHWFDRYEAALGPIRPWAYDRDAEPLNLEGLFDDEQPETKQVIATAYENAIADGDFDEREHIEGIEDAFRRFLGEWAAVLPACEAFDTAYIGDGKRHPSFRERLIGDVELIMRWQLGHAQESIDAARRAIVAAGRFSEGTEIDKNQMDTALTLASNAEQRELKWRAAATGIEQGMKQLVCDYPAPFAGSRQWHELQTVDACRHLVETLGLPSEQFVVYRFLWSLRRSLRRSWRFATEKLQKTNLTAKTRKLIQQQRNALEMLGQVVDRVYRDCTGEGITITAGMADKQKIAATARLHATLANWVAKTGRQGVLALG